ncbi:hypothetical protein BH11PSE11_BH11PSE11_02210 [soil metagenome]
MYAIMKNQIARTVSSQKRLFLFLSLAVATFSASAANLNVTVSVGTIGTYSNYTGAGYFGKADGTAFPGCSTSNTLMWSHPTATADGMKTVLAVLLTAKTTGQTVTVWYNTDDNYCRYQSVVLN